MEWSAAFTTLFDDGAVLTTYQDIDRTAQSIAPSRKRDAQTYRELARRCAALGPLLNAGARRRRCPSPAFSPCWSRARSAASLEAGLVQQRLRRHNPLLRIRRTALHYLKWIGEVDGKSEANGTGVIVYNLLSLCTARRRMRWSAASQKLSDALVRCIEHHGGNNSHAREVVRISVSEGRAAGVTLKDERDHRGIRRCPRLHSILEPEGFRSGIDEGIAAEARAVR